MVRTNKGNFISRTPKTHIKRKILSWIIGFLMVLGCGGIIYALFFSSLLHVTALEVRGNKLVSEEKIIQLVEQVMSYVVLGYLRGNKWHINGGACGALRGNKK
jgi:cell division septal protein FtsQ